MITVISAVFVLFIILLIVQIFKIPRIEQVPESVQPARGISIIIPFRNESENLACLLQSLDNQNILIPYEIVLVNDNSIDDYKSIIEKFQADTKHCSIILVNNSENISEYLTSKQMAIDTGVMKASYDLLVFSDADMEFSSDWLSNLTALFDHSTRPFIFGRTEILEATNLLSFVQKVQLDFLFGTAWLFAKMKIDSSCMGNNIALSRSLYESLGGQKGLGYSIVEDKKLLSAVKKKGITPLPSIPFSADAKTFAVSSWKTYLHQMLRWLKGGMGESVQLFLVISLLGGELVSLCFLLLGRLSLIDSAISLLGILLTWILYILLFARLKPASRGFQLPLFFIILIIESLFVLPSLIFVSPKWKGRDLSRKGKK